MEMDISKSEKEVLNLIDPDEVVSFLQTIIQKRSDYPPGDCRDAVQAVAEELSQSGVKFNIFTKNGRQPNLLAVYPEESRQPKLLFHSHIDTVPAGERDRWLFDPFSGHIYEENVYGRGAGDDKASVAAQVFAIITLARSGLDLGGSLQVAVVSDEESGGLNGTKWLHDGGTLAPDALVVGEQTDNHVAISERVACGIDLTIFGHSAHGAMPWAGENAILKAMGALNWLQSNLFPQLQERKHAYLPPPTLNVGKIQGGIQWSIVPERCKIEMDRRLLPGETREEAVEEIRACLDEYHELVNPISYELFSEGEVANNINTLPTDPFVELANKTLKDICNEYRSLTGYMQTSDGRWFASDNIPIIIFGPSKPEVAHAANEYVNINQLIETVKFLTILAFRWLGSK